MDLIILIKTTLNDFGLTFINDVPDVAVGIVTIILLIIILRTVLRIVSAAVKTGCIIVVAGLIAWIVLNLYF